MSLRPHPLGLSPARFPIRRLERLEDRLAPAVATWDGGGADNHWTTAANWVGNVAPQPGDDLVFQAAAAQLTTVNDFPAGTAFHSFDIGDNYTLTGNAVALASGLTVRGAALQFQIGLPLTLTADQAFSSSNSSYNLTGSVDPNGHTLTVIGEATKIISGPITGTGSLIFTRPPPGIYPDVSDFGRGTVLSGISTFTGSTTVSQAPLQVDGTLPGPVTVQNSAIRFSTLRGSGTVGDLTVNGRLFPGGSTAFDGQTAGTLKTGNLSLASTAQTQFSLFAPDSANALAVTGTVRVGGELFLNPVFPYQPGPGDRFTLINNDGTDPVVGTFAGVPEGGVVKIGNTQFRITYHGGDGNDLVATVEPVTVIAVGAGAGGVPILNVYDANNHLVASFFAYATSFRGGVRVATGDLTGDGVPEIITAPGPGGGPHVRVFDGKTFAVVREFMAYDPAFRGGVFVAASKINFDNQADIITGAGAGGGPHVKVFDGATGATLSSFFAYDPRFTGGVSVAGSNAFFTAGSVTTGAGPGGGPHVRVFDGLTGTLNSDFFAYEPEFRGGVNVAQTAIGIVTAPGPGRQPLVKRFQFSGSPLGGPSYSVTQNMAYDAGFLGGVNVVGRGYGLITGAGPGGGPHVRIWDQVGFDGKVTSEFFAFDPAFTGGVFVG